MPIPAVEFGIPLGEVMGDPGARLVESPVSAPPSLQTEIQPVQGGIVVIEYWIKFQAVQELSAPGPIAFHHAMNPNWDRALSGADVSNELSVPAHATGISPNLPFESRRHDPPSNTADTLAQEWFEEGLQPTRFGFGIVIEEGDDFERSPLKPATYRRDVSWSLDFEPTNRVGSRLPYSAGYNYSIGILGSPHDEDFLWRSTLERESAEAAF